MEIIAKTPLNHHHRRYTPMLARQINTNANKLAHVNSKDSGFTEAAIAGLAAKEDFSSIKLKRSNSANKSTGLYAPYKELMLMQIKGRRYCQTRLVEPSIDSLNNGDCFILIYNNRLFLWIGEHANVIEKAKANEIYDWIRFKKDLGLNKSQSAFSVIDNKTSSILDTLQDILENSNNIPLSSNESEEEDDDDSYYERLASKYQDSGSSNSNKLTNLAKTVQDFLLPLGVNRKNLKQLIKFFKQNSDNSDLVDDALSIDNNDEKFEMLMNETNMVFKISLNGDNEYNSSNNDTDDCENEDDTILDADGEVDELRLSKMMKKFCLEPVKPYWGQLLSYNLLDEDQVFVFDFGSELYIWNGRNASSLKKKVAIILSKQLFDSGYDYSSLAISPLKPLISLFNRYKSLGGGEEPDFIKTNKSRPKWTILGKQSQNCETVLFIEKFIDWPNQSNNPSLKKLAYNGAIVSSLDSSNLNTPVSTPSAKKNNVFFSRQGSVTTTIASTSAVSSPSATKADSFFKFEALTSEQIADKFFKQDYRSTESDEVNLVLENSNLGRGRHWFDAIERRSFDIVTENVNVWRIQDNQLVECPKCSFGELLNTNTYVIKWHYKINAVGFRTLKGEASAHQGITGRDRYALFFWQGELSSLNEKATSALLSLDLGNNASLTSSMTSGSSVTNEDGETVIATPTSLLFDKRSIPHVHLCQYKEIAAFCQLFDGSLIILAANSSSQSEWRMFELRGELEEESHLIEIAKPSDECLRSRTSFIFVNVIRRVFVIWHGSYSSDFHRSLIRTCATKLSNRNSKNFAFGNCDDCLEINEIDEGTEEEASFLYELFHTRTRSYHSLENLRYELNLTKDNTISFQNHSPRLFLMTSLYGQFELNEVLNPMRTKDAACPYPFYQFHLYEEKQPALFMLDNFNEVYIWQGWFESMSDVKPHQQQSVILQNELDATDGTAKIRYTINRKCAYQTAINYWQEKYANKEFRGFVVYAGLEPKEFTSLFPIWKVNENARNCNLNDGKAHDQMDSIQEILKQLNRDCYPLEVLRQRPLPDGVNPLKLECYLSDKEFEDLLKMSKEAFFAQPTWKQTNMKKKANLF